MMYGGGLHSKNFRQSNVQNRCKKNCGDIYQNMGIVGNACTAPSFVVSLYVQNPGLEDRGLFVLTISTSS